MAGMPVRPYYVDVSLRWSDMDALLHVNNVQFFRLLEEARVIAFRDWYHGPLGIERRPQLLVARAKIDYLRQLYYRDEPIVVAIWVTAIAGASFDTGYEVLSSRGSDAEVYARAETTQVRFDMEAQRPQRISFDDRKVLEAHVGSPVSMKRRLKGYA